MSMISPSLKIQVIKHIFLAVIERNPLFEGHEESIEFLVSHLEARLPIPEETIISQGDPCDGLYIIAKGDFTVYV